MLNNKLLILIRDTKRLFTDGGGRRTLRAPSYLLYFTESCMYLIALFNR